MVKSIILMRHAEREDRALENEGKDWIGTAVRPQDPLLSLAGREQAIQVGIQMRNSGVTKILTSPMIRTVITSDIIADQIGLGANTIYVEMGLVEEAKSFRGKFSHEPRPNWNPLVLSPQELSKYSPRINLDYTSLVNVQHVRDDEQPNTVREVHDNLINRDEVTRDRCRTVLQMILQAPELIDDVVLCVGHGATVGAMTKVLEEQLPEELRITGKRDVSCFAQFQPVDPINPLGPWKSVTPVWGSGNINISVPIIDNCEDQGVETMKEEVK
eukprot:gene5154-7174_t